MKKYSLASSTWGSEEITAMHEVIDSGNFTMGKKVLEYEEVFAKKVGSKFAVMVNSGSSANLALLAACRYLQKPLFENGDEIIVPAVSWSTTYYPVSQLGAVLKFVDVNLQTLNIDIACVEQAINSKTRAIFAVNLLGNPADWEALKSLSSKYGLFLLEDNCESLGANIGGKQTGTFGFGGTYSSFFSHHISTMEGGVVVTDDEALAQTVKSVRAHGWTRDLPNVNHVWNKTGSEWDDLFRFVLPGYNIRPLELEAAIGIIQLSKLDSFISQRRKNAEYFLEKASDLESFILQREIGESSWFGFSLVLQGNLVGRRMELVQALAEANIESRPIVAGNFTRNPVIQHLNHAEFDPLRNADHIHENGLFVGNHHYNLEEEIDLLIETLINFERRYQ